MRRKRWCRIVGIILGVVFLTIGVGMAEAQFSRWREGGKPASTDMRIVRKGFVWVDDKTGNRHEKRVPGPGRWEKITRRKKQANRGAMTKRERERLEKERAYLNDPRIAVGSDEWRRRRGLPPREKKDEKKAPALKVIPRLTLKVRVENLEADLKALETLVKALNKLQDDHVSAQIALLYKADGAIIKSVDERSEMTCKIMEKLKVYFGKSEKRVEVLERAVADLQKRVPRR